MYWFSQRSAVVITVLLFAVGTLLVFYLVAGFIPTREWVAIGISTIAVFFAAISAIANLLQAVETQKQRESQERPYIIAYFEGMSSGVICFVVKNAGNSPAKNITLQFDPPPVDFANRPLDKVSLFANPITFLPPM